MRKCDHCREQAFYYGDDWAECEACYRRGAKEFFQRFRVPRWALALRFLGWVAGSAFALYLFVMFIKFCWNHS
jgi:hypothetical protein